MGELLDHVNDYLKFRRDLGYKLVREGYDLPELVAHVEAAGATVLTSDLAIAWARDRQGAQAITLAHRLGAARGFARYMKSIDPATEIPPLGIVDAHQQRLTPYLWSKEEISALLEGSRQLLPEMRAATYETLLGLIAVTGMRLGEAIGLNREDINFTAGVLTIRQAKFDRARLVPLHPSTTAALAAYARIRDRLLPNPGSTAFFLTPRGTSLHTSGVDATFNEITTGIGLRTATARPRIHDLRHSFAVQTLIDWHRSGTDIQASMTVLSTYLGHSSPEGTYWYLTAVPELMELAAARLEQRYGDQS